MSQENYLEFNNLPNKLTIARIVAVPVIIILLYLATSEFKFLKVEKEYFGWVAGWLFVAASFTDFLDGYIARKRNIVTIFGSFLDPIADKFIVVSSLIMLLALKRLPAPLVIILVLREMYMTSLRLLATSEDIKVPVNDLGKWKTATQMMGIPMLMANQPLFGIPLTPIGFILIYISSFLSMYSAAKYTISMLRNVKTRYAKK